MNIGGKERKLKFGVNQSIRYCKFRNKTYDEMLDEQKNVLKDISILRDLLWSALVDDDDTLTPNQVGDWMDTLEKEEIDNFFNEMKESNSTTKKKQPKLEQK